MKPTFLSGAELLPRCTREIQIHPQLKEYIEEHHRTDRWHTRPHLFPGRHGRNHIRKVSADAILRSACKKLEIEGANAA